MQFHIVSLSPTEVAVTFSLMGEPICFMTVELHTYDTIIVCVEQLYGEKKSSRALFYPDGILREGQNVEVAGYWYFQCFDAIRELWNL